MAALRIVGIQLAVRFVFGFSANAVLVVLFGVNEVPFEDILSEFAVDYHSWLNINIFITDLIATCISK